MPTPSALKPPRDLTDEDVQILHQIITLAQDAQDADRYPVRALHRAYEDVLDSRNIPRRHDSLYLRFIYSVQNTKPGQSLLGRFEELLRERGIEIEAVDSEHSLVTRQSRRGSLNSFSGHGKLAGADRRSLESRASFSHYHEDTGRLSPGPGPEPDLPNGVAKNPFNLSTIANASMNVPRGQEQNILDDGDYDTLLDLPADRPRRAFDEASWHPEDFRYLNHAHERDHELLPDHYDMQPQEQILSAEAQIAREMDDDEDDYRMSKQYQDALWWDARALLIHLFDLFESAQTRSNGAIAWRQQKTLEKTFRHWHTLAKRKQDQHLRLPSEMQRLAGLGRQMTLLGKAFTHWAGSAKERTDKTKLAQQHLVSLRYFQAWKEHTISTEDKIKQHVCSKFLRIWRSRTGKVVTRASQVIDYREDTLLRRTLVHWTWRSREQYAAQISNYDSKRKAMQVLVTKLRSTQEREYTMMESEARHAMQLWQNRKRHVDQLGAIAINYEASHSLAGSFKSWRLQGLFGPLERDFYVKQDDRIMRSVFARMVQVFRLQQQGRLLNRYRVLHSAFDKWNSNLRSHSLIQRINERVLTETLYKWVLAERCQLYRRLRTERLLESCARKVLSHREHQSQELSNAYRTFKDSQKKRQQDKVLRKWVRKSQTQTRHQRAAEAKDDQRVAILAWDMIQLQYEKIELLETQYVPNFVLFKKGKETLRTLQKAVKQSQSKKRHEAYIAVRRRVKMKLCKKYLIKWRDDTLGVQALEGTAAEVHEGRLMTLGTNLFDQWKGLTTEFRQRELQVMLDRQTLIAGHHLGLWATRTAIIQDDTEKALEYDREHSRKAATKCLRNLTNKLHLIQDRQTGAYGRGMPRWSQRDLGRNLLRLWRERTLRQRGVPEAELPVTAKTRRFKNMLNRGAISQFSAQQPQVMVGEHMGSQQPQEPMALEQATPLVPTTPSRRFGRSTRTPARTELGSSQLLQQAVPVMAAHSQSQAQAKAPTQAQEMGGGVTGLETDTPVVVPPATDSRVRQSKTNAFGRSTTADVRRRLFAPSMPDRSSFP